MSEAVGCEWGKGPRASNTRLDSKAHHECSARQEGQVYISCLLQLTKFCLISNNNNKHSEFSYSLEFIFHISFSHSLRHISIFPLHFQQSIKMYFATIASAALLFSTVFAGPITKRDDDDDDQHRRI